MIVLIDNYDSFTWNLWHFLSELGANVKVVRNDEISIKDLKKINPEGIIISPGPGIPSDAGNIEKIIKNLHHKIPFLGVCLGHQAIFTTFGGKLKHISPPMHGKLSTINHFNDGIFKNLPQNFVATRYHSLVADEKTLPNCLLITALTKDKTIMGLQHKNLPIFGIQFHPESIASSQGYKLLYNFLKYTKINNLVNLKKIKDFEKQLLDLEKKFPDQVHD